jgi:hypothetical protein
MSPQPNSMKKAPWGPFLWLGRVLALCEADLTRRARQDIPDSKQVILGLPSVFHV